MLKKPQPRQQATTTSCSEQAIRRVCAELADFLVEKNKSYGDSFRSPGQIWQSDPVTRVRVRIEDKLSRIAHGQAYQGDDTELDLAGYFVLLLVLRAEARERA
jgi:hypothetical protein